MQKEIVSATIVEKHKLKELEDMLDKLNYYISVQDDEEKLQEYEDYKTQLIAKIDTLSSTLSCHKEEVKTYLSKLVYVVRKLENEIEMNKQLKREADNRIKSLNNSIDFLKKNITDTGKIIGIFNDFESCKLGSFTVRVNSKSSLSIKDKNKIPFEYQKEKIIKDLDNQKIKEDLENGVRIEGAELVHNLVITGGKIKQEENND